MTLADLLDPVTLDAPLPPGLAALDVTGLTADSRRVSPGTVFFAVPGAKADGLAFAAPATAAGAVAIVADRQPPSSPGVPVLVARQDAGGARAALARAAARFHGRQPETIVAVTGTSGKTSVSVFARQIWTETGLSAASLGTIGLVKPAGTVSRSLTTSDPVELHRDLAGLVREGVTHLAIEASSHGLDQRRLDGVHLKAAAFLNLSRDHLDYHPTLDAYFRAKMALFARLTPAGCAAVIAATGPWRTRAVAVAKEAGLRPIVIGSRAADAAIVRATRTGLGQDLTLRLFGRRYDVHLPLIGEFQAINALAALCLALATGSHEGAAVAALARLAGVPGRLETVGQHNGAPVVVDYAHKPAALATMLQALRPFVSGRLIVAFGCGGDRDAGKRPLMGRAAHDHADVVIVTDDNPRSEDPAAIRSAALGGAPGAIEIGDRADAIRAGIAMLKPGDLFVIAGKGHEDGQTIGGVTLPFSDRDVARAALGADR